jgi:DNA-binding Xre family transcriptional regulator
VRKYKRIDVSRILTYKAYADRIGVSDTTVRNFVKEGKLKGVELGGDATHKGVKFVILDK